MDSSLSNALTKAPGRGSPSLAPGSHGGEWTTNLKEFRRGPANLLLELHRQHGDIVRHRLGPYLTHLLVHPSYVDHVLRANSKNYVRGQFYERFKLFFGEGLLTTDGGLWKKHRRVVQPTFLKARIASMADGMVASSQELVHRLEKAAHSGAPVDMLPEMMRVTLAVLSRSMFGTDISESAGRIGPPVEVAIEAMMPQTQLGRMLPRWIPTGFNRNITKAKKALDEVVFAIIAERRRLGTAQDDLVSLLLDARDPAGVGLSDVEVHDEVMTILLAGHETTGTGLAWTLYALAKHPEVCRQLRSELDEKLAGRPPALADLSALPRLSAVVDEALRVYPPIWGFTRDAVEADEIGGFHIPAGSTVFLSPYVTHRHASLWENPDAFDPQRFIKPAPAAPFTYFPFGGGQRQCIGNGLALLQMKIITAMLVQHYDLHSVPGHSVEYGTVVSLRPMQGMPMHVKKRAAW